MVDICVGSSVCSIVTYLFNIVCISSLLLWLGIAAGSAVLLNGLLEPLVVVVLGVPLEERQQRRVVLEKHVCCNKIN